MCQKLLVGLTHSSDLPLLQEAGTGVCVISVGTGHLGLLAQHNDRAQALSKQACTQTQKSHPRCTRKTKQIKKTATPFTCKNSADTPSGGCHLPAVSLHSRSYTPQIQG